jgi:flagellar biosynthesis/type III secretory pathway M-ring protein FliF/YscJ
MEGKNIPLIIMLSAGSVVSIACIVYDFSLLDTLLVVLGTLVGFYIIGQIVKKIILTINKNAEEQAALLAAMKEETASEETSGDNTEVAEEAQEEITQEQ